MWKVKVICAARLSVQTARYTYAAYSLLQHYVLGRQNSRHVYQIKSELGLLSSIITLPQIRLNTLVAKSLFTYDISRSYVDVLNPTVLARLASGGCRNWQQIGQ